METNQTAEVAAYLIHAANIASPWRATRCRFDSMGKTLHIWITHHSPPQTVVTRNWLGMVKNTQVIGGFLPKGPDRSWRHLNCMDFICVIHTTDMLDPRHHELPWFGQTGLPFTNRMAKQLFACMAEGLDLAVICQMYNVTLAELWKFKHAMDQGLVQFDYNRPKLKSGSTPAGTPSQLEAAIEPAMVDVATGVPDVSDPVWEHILLGLVDVDVKTLGFQLLLTKLKQQVKLQQSEEVQILKMRELHRYVERNSRILHAELEQIRALAKNLES
jgi:hypothetical protein